jgi:hypothetical protein
MFCMCHSFIALYSFVESVVNFVRREKEERSQLKSIVRDSLSMRNDTHIMSRHSDTHFADTLTPDLGTFSTG